MLVHYRICLLALKLGVSALKATTPLLCQVSSGTWMYQAGLSGIRLRSYLNKEPSSVLYSLLGNIVEEGRRIGSVADIQVGDMNSQAPVGTTLALMERSMKVMSGVQARMHAAMKKELRLLSVIIRDYMPSEYAYEMDGDFDRQKVFRCSCRCYSCI